ncbi:MAG: hypothetical protein JO241_06370, partial [Candidatus Eremiobacteraeota bacterium]|nr:hypothetical protein [Candidatus Eremiobacteraeota bacterium]
MSARAIARLASLFVVLFVVLGFAQVVVQVVLGPSLQANRYNPMRSNPAIGRGAIVTSDGEVLAHSVGERRVYPHGELLAQAIGYASQRYGESGLEATFDGFLSAKAVSADPIAQLREIFEPASRPEGSRLVTTIDMPTQRALFADLSRYPHGAGVVIDPVSGDVLALASVPSFDPNHIDTEFARLASDKTGSPLLERATSGLYPPGS